MRKRQKTSTVDTVTNKAFTTLVGPPECYWKLSPCEVAELLQCDVLSFPSVTDIKELPKLSGVYFLIIGREIAYVGQTWRFDLRWKHHKKLRAEMSKGDARIALLVIHRDLDAIRTMVELFFIKRFKPRLNKLRGHHCGDVPFPG